MNYISQRVAILIDEVNIYLTAKALHGDVKINFESMLKQLNSREIIRAILYCVEIPEYDISILRNNVRKFGVEVKSKPIKIFGNGKRKGDWDVGVVLDAVELAKRVDVIVLVTGDGDFEDLVYYLKTHGVKVELKAFQEKVSSDLLNSVDEFIPITPEMLFKNHQV